MSIGISGACFLYGFMPCVLTAKATPLSFPLPRLLP